VIFGDTITAVPAARLPGGALEMWSAPFALVNADAAGLVPILLPIAPSGMASGTSAWSWERSAWAPLPRPWWATWPTATARTGAWPRHARRSAVGEF
jgi:hypothetical protein